MEGFDPRTSFGYDESKRYDAVDTRGDEEETVAFLARLAGQRDALEFAVGTGRIALPLTRAGVRVDGVELSQDMVDRMREKPDGNNVEVTMGDMSRVTTGRTYGLVYLVYNTIGNLLTQDHQPAPGPPARVRPHGPPRRPSVARKMGGWNGEPYTVTSWRHVSVYERLHDR